MNKQPSQIAAEFDAWLRASGLTEAELAKKILLKTGGYGVSQSWISRIRAGHFCRLSRKVLIVLDYANIRTSFEADDRDAEGKRLLDDALDEVWDGSLLTAKALALLLRSAGRIRQSASR